LPSLGAANGRLMGLLPLLIMNIVLQFALVDVCCQCLTYVKGVRLTGELTLTFRNLASYI
jgi:hypothetical protein